MYNACIRICIHMMYIYIYIHILESGTAAIDFAMQAGFVESYSNTNIKDKLASSNKSTPKNIWVVGMQWVIYMIYYVSIYMISICTSITYIYIYISYINIKYVSCVFVDCLDDLGMILSVSKSTRASWR